MPDMQLRVLIEKLCDRTSKGRIIWERTVVDGTFQTAFPGYVVQLKTRPSRDGDAPSDAIDFVLSIYNDAGELVEEVSDLDFGQDVSVYQKLSDLYQSARRNAMGVNKAVDTILKELDLK